MGCCNRDVRPTAHRASNVCSLALSRESLLPPALLHSRPCSGYWRYRTTSAAWRCITKYHRLGGLKQQQCILSELKVSAGPRSLRGLQGRILPCLFQFLVAPDIPCGRIPPISASHLPLWVHLLETLIIGFRAHRIIQGGLISRSLSISAKTLFKNKVAFTGSGMWAYLWREGVIFQPLQVVYCLLESSILLKGD